MQAHFQLLAATSCGAAIEQYVFETAGRAANRKET
jgi:hypothetical protein